MHQCRTFWRKGQMGGSKSGTLEKRRNIFFCSYWGGDEDEMDEVRGRLGSPWGIKRTTLAATSVMRERGTIRQRKREKEKDETEEILKKNNPLDFYTKTANFIR